ncbi:acyl-CoA dehydrogenase C-terminal domain-containing protein [Janibacter terrae]|uniref:acyl-CoA dehydrogenase C-terminal domain-containing protein n=1 Tax=Janibacter terrae TaxID=103817 RepID=UPI0031F82E61
MTYVPPLADTRFALHEVIGAEPSLRSAGIDIDRETIDEVLEGIAGLAAAEIAPLNAKGDAEGVTWTPEGVRTPAGFKAAYDKYAAGGWPGIDALEEHGGGGMPHLLGMVVKEMIAGANPSWALYTSLSAGVYRCLNANASDEVKDTYLTRLASGQWTGTMCLTEPHCGTDLGMLTTRAVPNDDGTWSITGTKIFISSGDHDLTDNIVHLVLARVPDAPSGVRGISLFVVPRQQVLEDGSVGGSNGVTCDGVESKMGLHGSATCTMRFEGAVGRLVGEVNRGLPAMFVMMNGARVGTGTMALGISEASAQASLGYARERLQSKAPGALRDPSLPADPILHQPDVRRMLLTQQAWIGGARMFLYWLALQTDVRRASADTAAIERADELLALLTPIAKAFVTDRGVDVTSLGMQIHGGAGYITETGVEQHLRDARVLPIYEGTNGVQAHDLLGRKVVGDGGARLKLLTETIQTFADGLTSPELTPFAEGLRTVGHQVDEATTELLAEVPQDELRLGTSAVAYQELVGHYVIAWFWAQAAAVVVGLGDAASPTQRRQLALARFYFDTLLPATDSLLARTQTSPQVLMDPAALPTTTTKER